MTYASYIGKWCVGSAIPRHEVHCELILGNSSISASLNYNTVQGWSTPGPKRCQSPADVLQYSLRKPFRMMMSGLAESIAQPPDNHGKPVSHRHSTRQRLSAYSYTCCIGLPSTGSRCGTPRRCHPTRTPPSWPTHFEVETTPTG